MKFYALLGQSLGHSFSRSWFETKFKREGISGQYFNLEVNDLSSIRDIVLSHRLSGFNVTIPYKTSIIPYLDALDPLAGECGAVNVVKCEPDGRWRGFNTDIIGFRETLRPFLMNQHQKALILGTGGASRAVQVACRQLGLLTLIVSRSAKGKGMVSYQELDAGMMMEYPVIINATPLGTHPQTDTLPPIPYEGLTSENLLYDLVYNPPETAFLKEGAKRGAKTVNGYPMLERQAEESWLIWTENQTD